MSDPNSVAREGPARQAGAVVALALLALGAATHSWGATLIKTTGDPGVSAPAVGWKPAFRRALNTDCETGFEWSYCTIKPVWPFSIVFPPLTAAWAPGTAANAEPSSRANVSGSPGKNGIMLTTAPGRVVDRIMRAASASTCLAPAWLGGTEPMIGGAGWEITTRTGTFCLDAKAVASVAPMTASCCLCVPIAAVSLDTSFHNNSPAWSLMSLDFVSESNASHSVIPSIATASATIIDPANISFVRNLSLFPFLRSAFTSRRSDHSSSTIPNARMPVAMKSATAHQLASRSNRAAAVLRLPIRLSIDSSTQSARMVLGIFTFLLVTFALGSAVAFLFLFVRLSRM